MDLSREAEAAAELLRSLAHPRRLLVLCALAGGAMSAGELSRRLGAPPANLSQHLARLRLEGLVECRRDGTSQIYRLADGRAAAVVATVHRLFCGTALPLDGVAHLPPLPPGAGPIGEETAT